LRIADGDDVCNKQAVRSQTLKNPMSYRFLALSCAVAALTSFSARASVIATYTFTGSETATPTAVNGVTFSTFSRGSDLSTHAATDQFGAANWTTATTRQANDYVQFTITPNTNPNLSAFTLNKITFDVASGSKAPTSLQVEIIYGANTANSGIITLTRSSVNNGLMFDLSSNPISTTNVVTIRFHAWSASNTGSGDTLDFDNVQIDGVAPVPEPHNVALAAFLGLACCVGAGRRLLRRMPRS